MNRIKTDGTWISQLIIENLGKDLPENLRIPEQRQLAPFDYDTMTKIDRYIYTVWLPYEDYGL